MFRDPCLYPSLLLISLGMACDLCFLKKGRGAERVSALHTQIISLSLNARVIFSCSCYHPSSITSELCRGLVSCSLVVRRDTVYASWGLVVKLVPFPTMFSLCYSGPQELSVQLTSNLSLFITILELTKGTRLTRPAPETMTSTRVSDVGLFAILRRTGRSPHF